MTKTIEVIVKPDGQIELTTQGFFGSACQKATLFLRRALGLVNEEKLTQEYYQAAHAESQRVQNGD